MAAKGSKNYGRLVTYSFAGKAPYPFRVYCKLDFFAKALVEYGYGKDVVLAHGRPDYLLPLLQLGAPVVYNFQNPIGADQVQWLRRRAGGPLALVAVSDAQR